MIITTGLGASLITGQIPFAEALHVVLGALQGKYGASRDLLCYAIGVERQGRLIEPLTGGRRRTVGTGVGDSRCVRSGELTSGVSEPEIRSYVDDATTPAPRPVRVVVAGLLGDQARSAELLGAGAPRALTLGRHGTFLVILGPQHAGANLRVRLRPSSGGSRTPGTSKSDLIRPHGRCVPTPGASVRVADPDGGPPWTSGRGRIGRVACRYIGQLIDDRVAFVPPDGRNWVNFTPVQEQWFPNGDPARLRDRPLTLRVPDS